MEARNAIMETVIAAASQARDLRYLGVWMAPIELRWTGSSVPLPELTQKLDSFIGIDGYKIESQHGLSTEASIEAGKPIFEKQICLTVIFPPLPAKGRVHISKPE